MNMPLAEILDRISIVRLKQERIGEPHLDLEMNDLVSAVDWNVKAGNIPINLILISLFNLYYINAQIWDLEADIRKGKEGALGLEEVGKRALQIRDLNRKRVSIKALIVDCTNEGYKDVKANHASENP